MSNPLHQCGGSEVRIITFRTFSRYGERRMESHDARWQAERQAVVLGDVAAGFAVDLDVL